MSIHIVVVELGAVVVVVGPAIEIFLLLLMLLCLLSFE